MDVFDVIDLSSFLVSIIAIAISIIAFCLTRRHLLVERVHRITDRLYEINKCFIDYPEIQILLYREALRSLNDGPSSSGYFVMATKHDELYFRVKTLIYNHFNLWDELFCIASGDKYLERVIELEAWKAFIIKRMRHPLFREVFDRESPIWGENFRQFIESHRSKINEPVDPELS